MSELRAGFEIAGYILVSPIGRGGMAEVWVAKRAAKRKSRAQQSKYAAIKVIAHQHHDDPRFHRMFQAEAELSSVLSHANIVQVFDEGEEHGRAYLVMEWVDGIDLVKLRKAMAFIDDARLRVQLAAYIVGQLLHGLAYAHEVTTDDGRPMGIVHRDVSPHNVLVSNHGEIKLTDFGIAHVALDETSGLYVKGKIRYMAPEHLAGHSRSPSVDLYAVGAIFQELVEGKVFRHQADDERVMYGQVLGGINPPLQVPLDPELVAVLEGLLAPDPNHRFSSGYEALDALKRWPGYSEMKLELARVCRAITGIEAPRTGITESDAGSSKADVPKARDRSAAGPHQSSPTSAGPGGTVVMGNPHAPMPQTQAVEPDEAAFADAVRRATTFIPAPPSSPGSEQRAVASAHGHATSPGSSIGTAPHLARDERGRTRPWGLVVAGVLGVLALVGGGTLAVVRLRPPADDVADATVAVRSANAVESREVPEAKPKPEAEATLVIPPARGQEADDEGVPGEASREADDEVVPAEASGERDEADATDEPAEAADRSAPDESPAAVAEPSRDADASAERDEARKHDDASRKAESPRAGRSPAPPKKKTVAVHVRLTDLDGVELRIGPHAIKATPYFDGLLTPGRHRVRWRPTGTTAWRKAKRLTFADNGEYILRLSPEGLTVRER